MAPLANSRVLLIGGSSGIGFGVAKASLAEGATVIIASSSKEKVDAAATRLGNPQKVITDQVDITSEESIKSLFARVGELDHLVITTGRASFGNTQNILEVDLNTKRGMFDDRFWGVLYSVQQAVPRMKNGGSITFTSGTVVVRPLPGLGHLVGAAGSLTSTTYGLAFDLASKNVRVNTIAPGLIDTELFDSFAHMKDAIFENFKQKIPLGRVGTPSEVAEAYLFAMKCTFLTGQVIFVDGGQIIA